ncbi:Factor arrest protein 11 [Gryganskiella cystojenkinii]|nr:Factor arrest protein 11 [Gryganskiella cystojenkinii]
MAQLRQFVNGLPSKQKQEPVHFQYADMDTVAAEIDEFYSYTEIQQFVDSQQSFLKSYDGDWQKSTVSERKAYAEYLLDFLDQKSDAIRFSGAKQLIYIAQGAYATVANEDDHLDWIVQNNKMLRRLGAFQTYYDALRIACSKLPTEPGVAVEIEALVTLLYMLVISHEDDEEFMGELAATDPSLTVFLYDQICFRPAKDQFGLLKKMLLLLWKVMRTTLGGTDDFPVLKSIARRMLGDTTESVAAINQKSDPLDYHFYQSEMSQKYPAYIPTNASTNLGFPTVKISTMAAVLQAKTAAGAGAGAAGPGAGGALNHGAKFGNGSNGRGGKGSMGLGGNMSSGLQPFIFPSSSMESSTPRSIIEAEELFQKNMYISTATLQIFHEKKLMTDMRYRSNEDAEDQKSGRAMEDRQPKALRANRSRPRRRSIRRRDNSTGNGNQGDDEADSAGDEEDNDESENEQSGTKGNGEQSNDASAVTDKERERIERIEHIYRGIVPRMAQIQVTLLKTLLVCIKVSGGTTTKDNTVAAENATEAKETVDPFTRVNEIREHEIMAKAVASILLLQLQHFKIYHVLAFDYVCQLLLDSNCLLLLLKIFGNNENPGNIHTKNEMKEYNFFWFCQILRETASNSDPHQARSLILQNAVADIGDPIPAEYICRRNMFAIINLLRVLQKMTKHKTHRVLLLVQYKSSAILKRLLKINHPELQKYVYKALKSQVPFLGRKWRSTHMKVITGIYIYCRSNLRDDWISGADVEKDLEDALPTEQQLRNMIRHYHDRVHPNALVPDPVSSQQAKIPNGRQGVAGHTVNNSNANQYSGPKYDWQEMYEAHASIPEVGGVDKTHHHHHSHQSSGSGVAQSDSEESVRSSTGSHHSHYSGSGNGRRDLTLSDIELDAGFEENYEEWLEAEVFGKSDAEDGTIGKGLTRTMPPFKYNDFYFDDDHPETTFLNTPGSEGTGGGGGGGGGGWDTPAFMPSDDEGGIRDAFNFRTLQDEELFKQINWTPNLHSNDASVEQSYWLEEVSGDNATSQISYFDKNGRPRREGDIGDAAEDREDRNDDDDDEEDGDEYSRPVAVDADSGIDLLHQPRLPQSRPFRVRKSDMGTEWVDENEKEDVLRAYGPSPLESVGGMVEQ